LWCLAVVAAAGLLMAAAPAAVVLVRFVSVFGEGRHADWRAAVVGAGLMVVAVVVPAVVVPQMALRGGVRVPGPSVAGLAGVQAAAMAGLDRLAPFRPGLLSVLLYGAAAVPLAVSVLARTWRAYAASAVLAAAISGLAVLVGLWQQAVGAWEWTHAAGVPSRAWLQVINIPGKHQEPYDWDGRSQILGGYWDTGTDPGDSWAAVEAVTSSRSDMFTALAWAEGGNPDPGNTRCTRQGADLWQCANTASYPEEETAFVRRSDGVMIILTGDDSPSLLLRSIRAAHPATDAELRSRTALAPLSPLGWLLL
jgi:hypothetical protein